MSVVEEHSAENEQKEAAINPREDDVIKELDPAEKKDENMETKDVLKTSQSDRRTIGPLSLLKEDFSQFKEEVLKVFRDSSQTEDRPVSSTLDLLKEDLSQFREDVTSVFMSTRDKDSKSVDPKSSQMAEKTNNLLSSFREDLSNVFRFSLSKDRDAAKDDQRKAGRTEEPLKSLFTRETKTPQRAEDTEGGKETLSDMSEEQIDDDGFSGNLSETVDNEQINNMKERTDEPEDSEVDALLRWPQLINSLSPDIHPTAEQRCEIEERSDDFLVVSEEDETTNGKEAEEERGEVEAEKEEDKDEEEAEQEEVEEEEDVESQPETLLSLSSVISLFNLRDQNKDDTRAHEVDVWSVKNFACYLTFDPNTANSELKLTDGNRKVTRVWSDHRPSNHPDRFERCPQVLCREGLLDSVYWEVEWSGGADIGVAYNNICRDGDTASCLLGHNERSWSLECSEGSYTPCHNKKRFKSSSPQPFTRRVGVHLDWSAGALSFYCVSKDAMVHLHTFTSNFYEPLYPAFWVWTYDGSVALSQVELDWERLLQ
ncbi:uncharacterized protein LKV04_021461 [Tautogolabrus adspersus]